MKQWNGLLRKEWVQWRASILVVLILLLVGLITMPSLLGFLTGVTAFEITMVIGFVAAGACVLVPVIAFATMFNKDMKRPDLWLHSTASTSKLVGVKLFMSTGMGVAYLLLISAVVAVRYLFASPPDVMFGELLFAGIFLISAVFLGSIEFLIYGFFFIVIDQLLKPFLKGFSFVVTLISFIISVRVYAEFTNSTFFETYIKVGRFDLQAIRNPNIDVQNGLFTFTSSDLYIGEIGFSILFTVGLFYLAIALFEKKVRL